jgi:hypothetical protein
LFGDVTVSKNFASFRLPIFYEVLNFLEQYLINKKELKRIKITKKIMQEIISVALSCFVLTLVGLALGFVFLQVQANT